MHINHLNGESVGVRTRDLLIKSQLLYQLSYALPFRGRFRPGWKWAEHMQTPYCGQPIKSRLRRSEDGFPHLQTIKWRAHPMKSAGYRTQAGESNLWESCMG